MADKLIVTGLGKPLDGEYEFSLVDLISRGAPGSMTNGELHRVKLISGIVADEITTQLFAGDNDILVALAAVLLARAGKYVDDDDLWNAQPATLTWDLEVLREVEASPPAEPAETPEQKQPSPSGGPSSELTLESPVNVQSPTTDLGSARSATSNLLRSVV